MLVYIEVTFSSKSSRMIEAASSADRAHDGEQWYDAYRVLKWSDAKVTVFDFTDVETVPESHWIEAQKCERREIAGLEYPSRQNSMQAAGRILDETYMPR